jgi:tRNA(fMet)-specific endonuclease VapC
MLDTNIVIHARDSNDDAVERLKRYAGAATISALTLVELQRGLYTKAADAVLRQSRLKLLLQQIEVVSFDAAAAEAYGRIILQLGWVKGRDFDRMIAAHAISTHATLVTANASDFRDIPGLTIEDWLAP